MVQKPLNKHCLDSSDVFILDMGLKLYQWNGKAGNKDERYKAAAYIQGIKVKNANWFVVNHNDINQHLYHTDIYLFVFAARKGWQTQC